MPKVGMEPIRRAALVKATIAEIGEAGTLGVTVSQIAKRAGMSSGLAHHYFGGKDQIFLAAMRHTLALYAAEVRGALSMACTPQDRIGAIVHASFAPSHFQRDVIAAWLNFYVLAQSSQQARHLLGIYQRRLQSNLIFALRPLVGSRSVDVAEQLAGMIDGLYLRQSLGRTLADPERAIKHVMRAVALELAQGSPR
jgi:TetR/AcrR family transcriptional regulator, transcriptional repressor of bet genes